jgi:hypothetical protein
MEIIVAIADTLPKVIGVGLGAGPTGLTHEIGDGGALSNISASSSCCIEWSMAYW